MNNTQIKNKNIPEGWQQVKIKDVGLVLSGGTPATNVLEYWNGNIPWITPTEIVKLKGKYITNTEREITKLGLKNSSAKEILPMSLIICSRATVGECAINKKTITTNQGFKNIIPNNKINIHYLYYFIITQKNNLKNIASGSTFLEFSKNDLEKLKFLLPPLPEQNRIVEVLETWDKYLEDLDKKIKIKKKIKKGLMQKLLSGDKRLKGFSGEWKKVKLGDVCNIKRGEMITKNMVKEGNIPVIAGGKQPAYYHNIYNYDGKTVTVSGSGASAGYINYFKSPIFASDCSVIKEIENKSNIDFIYYQILIKQKYIYSLQSGGAQPHIYPKDLSLLKINIPESIKEQQAIAEVLIKADEEIEKLEEKRKVIADQKKYLLNNLITGKIRVPA